MHLQGRPYVGHDESAASCLHPEEGARTQTPELIRLFRENREPGVHASHRGLENHPMDSRIVFGRLSNAAGAETSSTAQALTYKLSSADELRKGENPHRVVGKSVCHSTKLPSTVTAGFTFGRFMGPSKETAASAMHMSDGTAPAQTTATMYSPHQKSLVGERAAPMLDWSKVRGVDKASHAFGASSRKQGAVETAVCGRTASANAPFATSFNVAAPKVVSVRA